ncbi:hypothetical protein T484DRAFT_1973633 [Baffinella frigidus]|nr:hypothetical protein T484DRAFT_1973633 [Cryptophyta sp. CCMP2293]
MGAEQSQEGGEPGPELSSQDLARQAADKARGAQGSGRGKKNVDRQVAAAGQAAARQALYRGQEPRPESNQALQQVQGQGGKWEKMFQEAKDDEEREAAGQVVHPGIGPAGSAMKFNPVTRESDVAQHGGSSVDADAAAGDRKTYGVKIWPNSGNKYEGEFVRNKYHGRGKLTYADGRTCEGDWVQGYLHGKGTFRYSNGDHYEGDFKGGVMDGQGRFVFRHGDIYVGGFSNGKRHGRGQLKSINGDGFKGMWKDGKPDMQIMNNVHR